MRQRIDRKPVSLVAGATAALRRVLADVSVVNSPPSGVPVSGEADAIANPGYWDLWVTFDIPDASTSIDVKIWYWSETAQKWTLEDRPGTAGVVTLTDASEAVSIFLEGPAARYLYIELDAMTGIFTTGVSAWVEGMEPQPAPAVL